MKLNIENPFFTFMGRMADIVIVNLLFLVCCIPIVTIGASMSALYQTTREMRTKLFISSFRSFFRAFRMRFKVSAASWLVQLVSGILLVFDLMFVTNAGNAPLWHISGIVLGSLLLLWLFISCYLMPADIYKNKTIKEALIKSFYLAVRNLPYTLVMTALNIIPVICFILGELFIGLMTPIYIVIGFGMTAYVNSFLMDKCKDIDEIEKIEDNAIGESEEVVEG